MILLHGASSRTGSQPACSPQQHDECTWMGAILASSPRAEYFLMNHTANHYSWGKCTGPNEPFFFEDDSRRAVFTSPARHRRDRGASRETDSIFSTLKGRPAGHGARVRASLATGNRSIPRRPSRTAPRSALRGRRENGRPVEKKTQFYIVIQDSPSGSGMFPAGGRKLACRREKLSIAIRRYSQHEGHS